MKVKDLIESLEEFKKKLIEHQTLYLYGNSFPKYTGGMYPVKNISELQKQSNWLNRQWGKLQKDINQLIDKGILPITPNEINLDYANVAIGLDEVAPYKSQSMKKLIAKIERIIGGLESMNPKIEFYDGSSTSEKEIKLSISNIWDKIKNDFDISKYTFSRKINFVKDPFKKKIIFRDIEQTYLFAEKGFSKPAVILAGGVIEELLRLYLESKNIKPPKDTFDEYIRTCENNGLFKKGISTLSDSIRHFRNIVHLEKEVSGRYTISKATAKGAISSIFTISNEF
ncbi:MAG: hypothetical protein A2163_05740 [Actinobacteria bacterium RBG_13_35_12]|nr:MAG: hypothetical protein A2163_05740 [Actinobacteria bacterium RBG_13_35_12]